VSAPQQFGAPPPGQYGAPMVAQSAPVMGQYVHQGMPVGGPVVGGSVAAVPLMAGVATNVSERMRERCGL
jgi:hypothetical protein